MFPPDKLCGFNFDLFGFGLFRFRANDGQDAVSVGGLDFGGVHRLRQGDAALETAIEPFGAEGVAFFRAFPPLCARRRS